MTDANSVKQYLLDLQASIVQAMEEVDRLALWELLKVCYKAPQSARR